MELLTSNSKDKRSPLFHAGAEAAEVEGGGLSRIGPPIKPCYDEVAITKGEDFYFKAKSFHNHRTCHV